MEQPSHTSLEGAAVVQHSLVQERHRALLPVTAMVGDPAHRAIKEILRIVPASEWAFARVAPGGELKHLLASNQNRATINELKRELDRQRKRAQIGTRIAAGLRLLNEFESSITLLFADADSTLGILSMLRTAQAGPFTSVEVSVLTLALSSTSELLSRLPLNSRERWAPLPTASEDESSISTDPHAAAHFLLDNDFRIILAWSLEDEPGTSIAGMPIRVAERLPSVLEEIVRSLTSGWGIDPHSCVARIARPVPFLVVRVQPVSGAAGRFIGVRIDRFRPVNSLAHLALQFRISPRELEVLTMLLEGASLRDICVKLSITSSTVQDHIRSMVEKTHSRNRTQLVARILGWDSLNRSEPL